MIKRWSILHSGFVLSAGLRLKTRIPSTQESYLLLFIWSPLPLWLMCSLFWVSHSISRTHPACLLSEFQNFLSPQTGLLVLFYALSNLLVRVTTGFSNQIIIVLSPKSSLSWSQIAPFSWVQSSLDYCWESEFNILQNVIVSPTASFFFFFFQKSTLLLRSWAFFYLSRSFPAHLSLQREDFFWKEGVEEEFIIPVT